LNIEDRRLKMRAMPISRRWRLLAAILVVAAALTYLAVPYVRAASLFIRVAHTGGRVEQFANEHAHVVTIMPPHTVRTRLGDVPAQFYRPDSRYPRSVLLIPGIHSMGIREPRLTALAKDLAGSGDTVMTLALPDLQRYQLTTQSTDVIEDAVTWMARQPDLAPDGRIGVIGISFAGGLSIVAAGRPSIRNKVAYVLSFGGHADLPRVLRYLATGMETQLPGVKTIPPHDYGVAVILHQFADQGIVPKDQIAPLRKGVETFLYASQLTLVDMNEANATFQKAREYAKTLPEPARTYMTYVNDRNVAKLGPALLPYLSESGVDSPTLSADRSTSVPTAPVFLLHGSEDSVIPTAESVLLADYLRKKGADVDLLVSELITHAEIDRAAAAGETMRLVSFWADVLKK
jgi:dienelactone hydrolase